MNLLPFVLIAVIGISLIGFFFYFSRTYIIKRRLKNMPVTPIAGVTEGKTVRITGVAHLVGEPLIAPISGRECCYYHIVIKQRVGSGKNSRWVTLLDKERSTEYVVEDNSSFAYINSTAPMTHIVKDAEKKSGLLNNATPQLEQLLNSYGHKSENWLGMNKAIEYREGIIEHGETITAMGTGEWLPASDLGLPAHYGNVLSISADPQLKFVYLSDDAGVV